MPKVLMTALFRWSAKTSSAAFRRRSGVRSRGLARRLRHRLNSWAKNSSGDACVGWVDGVIFIPIGVMLQGFCRVDYPRSLMSPITLMTGRSRISRIDISGLPYRQ